MQLELFAKRYPEVAKLKQYAHVGGGGGSVQLDGWFYPDELKVLADFLEKVGKDFYAWYAEVRKFDDQLEEEPVNVYWHDFCDGKTPGQSYRQSGKTYGRKRTVDSVNPEQNPQS